MSSTVQNMLALCTEMIHETIATDSSMPHNQLLEVQFYLDLFCPPRTLHVCLRSFLSFSDFHIVRNWDIMTFMQTEAKQHCANKRMKQYTRFYVCLWDNTVKISRHLIWSHMQWVYFKHPRPNDSMAEPLVRLGYGENTFYKHKQAIWQTIRIYPLYTKLTFPRKCFKWNHKITVTKTLYITEKNTWYSQKLNVYFWFFGKWLMVLTTVHHTLIVGMFFILFLSYINNIFNFTY